jgi:hypothetical protein
MQGATNVIANQDTIPAQVVPLPMLMGQLALVPYYPLLSAVLLALSSISLDFTRFPSISLDFPRFP